MCLKDWHYFVFLVIFRMNKNLRFSYRIFLDFLTIIIKHQIYFGVFEAMSKDFKSGKVKCLPNKNLDLPNFVNYSSEHTSKVSSVEGTNVIRVPFGKRFPKKQRPDKNQSIATLILPINTFMNPTPPHVA